MPRRMVGCNVCGPFGPNILLSFDHGTSRGMPHPLEFEIITSSHLTSTQQAASPSPFCLFPCFFAKLPSFSTNMSLSLPQGFTKSLVMTMVSEFGDRTFCVAAVMTVLSALVGWAAPNLISRKLAHNVTTLLFFVFGLWSLWDAYNEDDDDNDELAQVEKELDDSAASKSGAGKDKAGDKGDDDLKKQKRAFLRKFFSPVFLKAFSVTFFGEWGDKSQLATIGLAADEDTVGVILGGILAQAICTIAAVIGGKSLASRVSERLVTLLGGVLFLLFGVQSFFSRVD
ncbi:UNVERIFIED_CONTAM: GDT1-like protein 5 [Sesamum calycinum]|uniref:GDT1 family protein n=1 Tax=Sesamum calycinum TaxID=2727403 RepID=A0AAW2SUB9_9LAMI